MKEGWATKSIGEACEVVAGQSPAGSSYNSDSKGLPFYQGKKEFDERYIGPPTTWTTEVTKRAKANDILMSVRAPVGPINFATQEICIGRGLAAIRAKQGLDQNFLFYFLLSIQSQINGRDGAVFPSISRNEICSISLPVPPLPQQQRIVAILDEAFAGLATATANAEKNLKNARDLFNGYLSSIFAEEDDGSVRRVLSDLCRGMTVGHVGPMATRYKPSGTPFLRSQNIKPFEISLDEVVFIDDDFHRSLSKSRLSPGDVAIVRTGYPGTAAVIPEELKDANCADLVIVRPGDEIMPDYIAAFFNSSHGKRLVGGAAVGAAQKHFNVTAAKAVKIKLPNIGEQKRIVNGINAMRYQCRMLESVYQRKLAHLAALKQSVLERAFSGELTSPPSHAIKEAAE